MTNDSEGVNWIKIGDAKPGAKYIESTAEHIIKTGADRSRFVKKGDLILSNSMSFGRPYVMSIDGCIHDGWLALSDYEKYVSADYLYYVLSSSAVQAEMKQRASFGGAVQNLNADIVRSLNITIPDKRKQQETIETLDRFDDYCNGLSDGLPAEIEARQKQYEYYRDKLLSFKKLEN